MSGPTGPHSVSAPPPCARRPVARTPSWIRVLSTGSARRAWAASANVSLAVTSSSPRRRRSPSPPGPEQRPERDQLPRELARGRRLDLARAHCGDERVLVGLGQGLGQRAVGSAAQSWPTRFSRPAPPRRPGPAGTPASARRAGTGRGTGRARPAYRSSPSAAAGSARGRAGAGDRRSGLGAGGSSPPGLSGRRARGFGGGAGPAGARPGLAVGFGAIRHGPARIAAPYRPPARRPPSAPATAFSALRTFASLNGPAWSPPRPACPCGPTGRARTG